MQTEMVVGLETRNDLEDEQRRKASVSSLFSFSLFLSIHLKISEIVRFFPGKILKMECSVDRWSLEVESSAEDCLIEMEVN